MGLFRTGLIAILAVGWTTFAQQPGTVPAPAPGIPDTNAPVPAPAIPQPEPTPGVDPSIVQPVQVIPDNAAPPTVAKPKPKKPAAPALPTLRGTVASIDKTNMTVVIHGKSKDETLSVTSKTHIFADGKPAILSDAKEGENVTAEYRSTKEKTKEALSLRFGGGNSASSASSEKVEKTTKPAVKKAAAKKPSKAAAKKKSKTTPVEPAPVDSGITPLPDTTIPAPVPTPGPGVPVPAPGNP